MQSLVDWLADEVHGEVSLQGLGLLFITRLYTSQDEHLCKEEWHVECWRQGRPESEARLVMVGTVPVRVISFLLVAACGGLCQQRQATRTSNSLPDAPSAQVLERTEIIRTFHDDAPLPLEHGAAGFSGLLMPEAGQADASRRSFSILDSEGFSQKDSSDLFERYLYPSLLKRNLHYHPSTSGSFIGRATDAASSIFVSQDDSGRRRLNTSYFVGVLSSALIHTAYRPYWRRSASEPFSDFGSNIGNDAGMNFVHEFGPGIQQLVKSHAPRFVSKIENRIIHN